MKVMMLQRKLKEMMRMACSMIQRLVFVPLVSELKKSLLLKFKMPLSRLCRAVQTVPAPWIHWHPGY